MATRARGGGRTGGLALPLTDGSELRVSFGLAVRPRRRPKRARRRARWTRPIFVAFQAIAYAAVLVVVLGLALSVPAGGREGDGPLGERAFAGHILAAGSLAAPRTTVTAVAEPPYVVREHLVEIGEDLLSIAARYGVTPQTIAVNNGIADSAEVRPGRLLRIPAEDVLLYTVREGDTVEAVAARFGVDPEAIRERNRLDFEPANADPGAVLVVPAASGGYGLTRLHISDPPRVFQLPREAERGLLRLPVDGVITQRYSFYHRGVDIAAPYGSPIRTADEGTVTARGTVPVGGLHVCVRHDWGLETCYYHASAVHVEVGERVLVGQAIASIGMTGLTTGPHVHWEARTHGALVDPLEY